ILKPGCERKIPKGFRPKAQGCEERATLGLQCCGDSTLKGLCHPFGSVESRTPPQPFQGWHSLARLPRVARSSHPCAEGRNPFGIENPCNVQAGRTFAEAPVKDLLPSRTRRAYDDYFRTAGFLNASIFS